MRRLRPWLLLLAAAIGAYILEQRNDRPEPSARSGGSAALAGELNLDSVRAARRRILHRIDGSGTYLGATVVEMDSMLKHWHPRRGRPVAVFVPAGDVPGYQSSFDAATRRSFVEWSNVAGIPVRFRFVRDSAGAEVVVRWIDRFGVGSRTGQADVVWDQDGWILRGVLTLATHTTTGQALNADAVHTVALHEIGHLLGLGHSDDPQDVMSPTISVHDLTLRDRRTGTLLYALPPGLLSDPGGHAR